MHLLITDSGVGGLSVCAYAERFLRIHGIQEYEKLTYVNASFENDFGYNSMGSREEKIYSFDRFLSIVSDIYVPDSIYIACNTLSVLFPDTEFSKSGRISVQGIVETGVSRLLREIGRSPRSTIAIFGTPTTIEEQTYSILLQQHGIDRTQVVSQACSSLADTISEDREGSGAKMKIDEFVDAAIEKSPERTTHYIIYLACTHYGYRKQLFSAAFDEQRVTSTILNPNEFVVEEIFGEPKQRLRKAKKKEDVEVEFITRYKIPETALETIAYFLEDISPRTVEAFTNYTYLPGLF